MPLVFVAAEKLGGEPGSQAQKEKGRESWRAAAESRPCQGLPTVTGHWIASQGPPPPLLLPVLPVWASPGTFSGPFFFFFPHGNAVSLAPSSSREDGDTEAASYSLLLPSMWPEDPPPSFPPLSKFVSPPPTSPAQLPTVRQELWGRLAGAQ